MRKKVDHEQTETMAPVDLYYEGSVAYQGWEIGGLVLGTPRVLTLQSNLSKRLICLKDFNLLHTLLTPILKLDLPLAAASK
jgi:hypothetical protein